MDYLEKAKILKQNTNVLETTFGLYDFILRDFTIVPSNEGTGDCNVIVELTNSTKELKKNFIIKVNFYDENDDLYNCFEQKIIGIKFGCYDTIRIECKDCGRVLDIATKGRIYLKKA